MVGERYTHHGSPCTYTRVHLSYPPVYIPGYTSHTHRCTRVYPRLYLRVYKGVP